MQFRRNRRLRDEFRVTVVPRRGIYYARIKHPNSRNASGIDERSLGTRNKREAERLARDLERDIEAGLYDDQTSWPEFCRRYKNEWLSPLSTSHLKAWITAKNAIERIDEPIMVQDVNSRVLARFALELRKEGKSDDTIESYVGRILGALGWAETEGMIDHVPKVKLPKRRTTKGAKSRPITGEEFERMLDKVVAIRPDAKEQWQFFLKGLWESGFRISELLALHWTQDPVRIDTSFTYPCVHFREDGQKNQQDTYQPITPEFWALISEQERVGHPFVMPSRNRDKQMTPGHASKIVSAIGKAAGIVTGEKLDRKKNASAHDLRRSFSVRLGKRVTLAELTAWMRHQDPATTRRWYYKPGADDLAEKMWDTDSAQQEVSIQ